MKVLSSWSGGKDSCYALMKSVEQGLQPTVLLNMMNENGKVSRSHGIPLSILQQQAKQMQVPLVAIPATWSEYEKNYISKLLDIKEKYQIEGVVFGDIDLEPHRAWEEKVCNAANLKAFLTLISSNKTSTFIFFVRKSVAISKDLFNSLFEKGRIKISAGVFFPAFISSSSRKHPNRRVSPIEAPTPGSFSLL
jgi:uncharacterized protein (TIGR00290 family)